MSRVPLALAACLFVTCASAQAPVHVGTWTGTIEGTGVGQVEVEVVLTEAGGTWRMFAQRGRANPCMGKEFPVTARATADSLMLEIKGGEVIPGCLNQPATLVGSDYKGKLRDGRAVTLSRK